MTVIVGLADPVTNTAILLADSRVTTQTPRVHYDICQKVAQLGKDGLFGFAGSVDEAAKVGGSVTGTYKQLGPDWLASKEGVLGLFAGIGILGKAALSYIAAFKVGGRVKLARFCTRGQHELTGAGIFMLGSGAEVYDEIRSHFVDILNFAGPGQVGVPLAHRAMLLSHMVLDACRSRGVDSVGGLMQIHFVTVDGTYAVPYQRWVDIDTGYGTYVAMDIDEDGAWVQVHPPTGLRVPLRYPGEVDFGDPGGATGVNFELQKLLRRHSPGIIPTPNPVEVYRLYPTPTGDAIVRGPA